MREVFVEHRPAIVFHAAAYKHVGLMEANPVEAVRNNAIATRVMTRVAGDARHPGVRARLDRQGGRRRRRSWARPRRSPSGPSRRPTPAIPDTAFTCVRFGNVLGSSGSVVPIFRRQIAAGGPVTVTDPRMTRYFMTIPEAVQLVIRSGLAGARRRGVRARDGRAREHHGPRARHDPAVGPRAGARHRGRDHRPRGRGEAPRGALQPLRAPAADARAAHPARRSASRSIPPGSRRSSTRSGCWCSRATPPVWRPRCRARERAGSSRPRRPRSAAAARAPRLFASTPWSRLSRSPSRTRSRSTVPTRASPLSSAWRSCPCSTSRQAREVKRLREWAGRAPERAREIEERAIAQAEAARRDPRGPRRARSRSRSAPPRRDGRRTAAAVGQPTEEADALPDRRRGRHGPRRRRRPASHGGGRRRATARRRRAPSTRRPAPAKEAHPSAQRRGQAAARRRRGRR